MTRFAHILIAITMLFVASCGDEEPTPEVSSGFTILMHNLQTADPAPITVTYQQANSATTKAVVATINPGSVEVIKSPNGHGITMKITQSKDLGFKLHFELDPSDQSFVITDNEGVIGENQRSFVRATPYGAAEGKTLNITLAPFQEATQ